MNTRQEKLSNIINEIDEFYGFGSGFVNESTDVDKFISEFKEKFLIKYDLSAILSALNESTNKSYVEMLDEI